MMEGSCSRTTSVSPLDHDKDTLSLTREKRLHVFPVDEVGSAVFVARFPVPGRVFPVLRRTFLFQHLDLRASFPQSAVDFEFLAGIRVASAVVHCSSHGHRERNVVLDLLRAPVVSFQEVVHHFHLLFRAARKVGDEERNEVLFLARFPAALFKEFHEGFQFAGLTFPHQIQHAGMKVFRRNLEVP